MANANLFQSYLQPPRSVLDYSADMDKADAARLALALQKSQIDNLPLHKQLLELQLGGAQLSNAKQRQMMDLVSSILGPAQPANAITAAAGPGGPDTSAPPANPLVAAAGAPAAGAAPGASGSPAGLGGLTFPRVVGLKLLGGPDMTSDFKMGLEGVSHAPGSEVTAVDGTRRTVPTLDKGQFIDANGVVRNMPGFVTSAAEASGATTEAVEKAKNRQTLAPLDRIDPKTGRPYSATVGQLVDSVTPPAGMSQPSPLPIDQLSPEDQQRAIADMRARGQDPSTMKVNGNPAFTALQSQLDAARQAGPEGIARFQAQVLPRLLAIPDPDQRAKALQGFEAALRAPHGTPYHGGAADPAAPAASGSPPVFAGPADIAGAKARAEADVKRQTQPGITYADDVAKSAAAYKDGLDKSVASGQDLMQRVNESRDALAKFKPGMGSETRLTVARAAQAMGLPDSVVQRINNGDVSAKQEFIKLSAQTAMESLKQSLGSAGRITQAEFAVFQKNNPNIELDPNAIQKIYDFQTKIYKGMLAEQQGFSRYMANGGDPAQWPAQWAAQRDPGGTGAVGAANGGWKYIGPVKGFARGGPVGWGGPRRFAQPGQQLGAPTRVDGVPMGTQTAMQPAQPMPRFTPPPGLSGGDPYLDGAYPSQGAPMMSGPDFDTPGLPIPYQGQQPGRGPRRGFGGSNALMDSAGYADGGVVEPIVGTRAPLRQGGTGGGLSSNAILRAMSAAPAAPQSQYIDPMNPRSINAMREARADMTGGGAAMGPGGPTDDAIPARLSAGEHVFTTAEVTALGDGDNALGQRRLAALRAKLMQGR